jgi:hypothetical protein
MDIYVSSRNASGAWSRAVNLGPAINTAANEDAPFIHPNGKLLFLRPMAMMEWVGMTSTRLK